MRKIIALIAVVMFLTIGFGNMAIAKKSNASKGNQSHSQNQAGHSAGNGYRHGDGPAPNSHDGDSDGSGFSDKGGTRDDKGAPNSGDGVADGSGK